MKLDTVVKELRKDNWFTGITFIEDYRDFLQALVDETEKQLSLPVVVGQSEKLICDTCKSGLINYPEIPRRTCRCGRLGYNVTD